MEGKGSVPPKSGKVCMSVRCSSAWTSALPPCSRRSGWCRYGERRGCHKNAQRKLLPSSWLPWSTLREEKAFLWGQGCFWRGGLELKLGSQGLDGACSPLHKENCSHLLVLSPLCFHCPRELQRCLNAVIALSLDRLHIKGRKETHNGSRVQNHLSLPISTQVK